MKFYPVFCFFPFYLHMKFGTVHPQKFIKLLWVGAVKAIFLMVMNEFLCVQSE